MPSLSLASSPSEVAASTMVHKATSELLVGPDWTVNMEVCDFCNSAHWLAKDVVKVLKRRLRQKNAKVQLLTLTLLETMVKNCGDHIHKHIGDRKLLDEMIKLVKKKSDVHVRDKILVLLDSWQEAFGGPGRQFAQYYWACDELRRCGIRFPQRGRRSAPVITPAIHPGRGAHRMAPHCSKRLDEDIPSQPHHLSNSVLESMGNVVELLDSMLETVNPNDHTIVRDEVITDLVDTCRYNQKKLLKMLTDTKDKELLPRALHINYSMQKVLEKHDAITLGTYVSNIKNISSHHSESREFNLKTGNKRDKNSAKDAFISRDEDQDEDEDEDQDEIFQLAQRCSKASPTYSQSAPMGTTEDGSSSSSGSSSNALVLIDGPSEPTTETATANNTKEQDLIDLLSIVLTTSTPSSETTQAPTSSAPSDINFEASLNNYVVPWANNTQHQLPLQSPHQFETQYQNMQSWLHPQSQQQTYTQYFPYATFPSLELTGSNNYQNPPYTNTSLVPMQGVWRSHNGNSFQNPNYINQSMYPTTQAVAMQGPHQLLQQTNLFQSQAVLSPSSIPIQAAQPSQNVNSFLEMTSNGSSMNGNALVTTGSSLIPPGHQPYVPSYKLFEDLNVLGSSEGKLKGPYPIASGYANQNGLASWR